MIKEHDTILLEDETNVKIGTLLGTGAQGNVYHAKMHNDDVALKWYHQKPHDSFLENLASNIKKGAPNEAFIWPKAMTKATTSGIGFIMEKIPSHYDSLIKILNGKATFVSAIAKYTALINLAEAFKHLHAAGNSYRDINDGSFFFDTETGDVLICDTDNVSAYHDTSIVKGKMKYMAPEVLRGDHLPDVHSDRFSLAVIMFMILTLGHPFMGARIKGYHYIDETAEQKLFGSEPVYVFANDDLSNRPIKGYHSALLKRYPSLSDALKEGFHKTFTQGLHERENGRLSELQWIRLLCDVRDQGMVCPRCQTLNTSVNQSVVKCNYCHGSYQAKGTMQIGKHTVRIEPNKKLYEHHIDKTSLNYSQPIGEVIRNRKNPQLWGIKNVSNTTWTIKDHYGITYNITPNKVAPLVKTMQFVFNDDVCGHYTVKEEK